jgi:hypothetical protein
MTAITANLKRWSIGRGWLPDDPFPEQEDAHIKNSIHFDGFGEIISMVSRKDDNWKSKSYLRRSNRFKQRHCFSRHRTQFSHSKC